MGKFNMTVEIFDRIAQEPGIMGGKPCIRGMRVTVSNILSQIGAGEAIEELLVDYPYLEREDILQALQWSRPRKSSSFPKKVSKKACMVFFMV
jgi:uncharacterized protein (DUF433 family)